MTINKPAKHLLLSDRADLELRRETLTLTYPPIEPAVAYPVQHSVEDSSWEKLSNNTEILEPIFKKNYRFIRKSDLRL